MLVFFVALFIAASTVGPGVAGWAYTGESGSSRLRAKTTTLGTVGNALIGLIMTTCLPFLLDKAGAKTGKCLLLQRRTSADTVSLHVLCAWPALYRRYLPFRTRLHREKFRADRRVLPPPRARSALQKHRLRWKLRQLGCYHDCTRRRAEWTAADF